MKTIFKIVSVALLLGVVSTSATFATDPDQPNQNGNSGGAYANTPGQVPNWTEEQASDFCYGQYVNHFNECFANIHDSVICGQAAAMTYQSCMSWLGFGQN